MKRLTITLAALVLLAGCGNPPAATVTTVTTTATTTTRATTTVTATPASTEIQPESLVALRDALIDGGLRCADWQATSPNSGRCDDMTLMSWVPDSPSGRDLHRATVNLALAAMATRPDVSLVVGQRWTLRIGTVDAYNVQKAVGGTVLGGVAP